MAVPMGNEKSLKHPKINSSMSAQLFPCNKAAPPTTEGIEKNMMTIAAMILMKGTSQSKTQRAFSSALSAMKGMSEEINTLTSNMTMNCNTPVTMYRIPTTRL